MSYILLEVEGLGKYILVLKNRNMSDWLNPLQSDIGFILYLEVKESRLLYVYIYVFFFLCRCLRDNLFTPSDDIDNPI